MAIEVLLKYSGLMLFKISGVKSKISGVTDMGWCQDNS